MSHRATQARSCSNRCKQLFSLAKREGKEDQVPAVTGSNVVSLHGEAPPAPRPRTARKQAAAAEPATDGMGPLESAAYTKLVAAGREDDEAAIAVLAAAARIDNSTLDTASSLAALLKQYHASMDIALRDAVQEVDPVDELRRIREAKRRAVAG